MKNLLSLCALGLGLTLVACSDDQKAGAPRSSADTIDNAPVVAAAMNTSDPDVIKVAVPTIQCGSCARTIRKALRQVDQTREVKVDVKGKEVFVRVADNTPATRQRIEKAIAMSGYDAGDLKADPAAYEKLEDCCKVGGGMEGEEAEH